MATVKPYKAQGVVLHTVRYGDSSLIVYILTRGRGRQTYMVQGVRSSKGRGNKGALFQPMFIVELEAMELSNGAMHRIREVRNAIPLGNTPFDVRKSTISLFMAEVLYRLIKDHQADAPLFDFVFKAVVALDGIQEGVANFHLWFLVRLSYFLGFYPGNEYISGGWFDIPEGHFTAIKPHHNMTMNPDQALMLSMFMDTDLDLIHTLPLTRDRRVEFLSSMLSYFGYHLDSIHTVQSIKILGEVF